MTARLDAAEAERARTWNVAIASVLIGSEVPWRDEGKERRWDGLGGFSVCRVTGMWHSWASARGGLDTIELVKYLGNYSFKDAFAWVLSFITKHQGTGPVEPDIGEWTETRRQVNADLAQRYLADSVPLPEGGRGAAYLTSRGIPGPYPPCLRWYPNARPGEGEDAIVGPLIANDRPVAVQLTYIDALGAKSLVEPARRRFNLEPDHPGAVMEIAAATPGTIDISADVVICEGLENGLSINLVKNPAWRIIALPGIHALAHVALKPEERRVIVFQDSDPKGHPARDGLTAGVDALLLIEKQVRITEESEHGDPNDILRAEGLGAKELKRLLAKPAGAALSFEGKVKELSRLPETEYMKARREAAKLQSVPVKYLDREVARRRPKPASADDTSTEPSISLPVDPPWTGPVPQLSQLLDRIVVEIRRYVVLLEWQAHIIAVWVALTYFVFASRINLQVMPRLAVQSAEIASGKTSLLRLVCTLVRHGKIYGRSTAAGIYRALSQAELTLCLDEVEFLQYDPHSPMMQVLDSSHHREDANILLAEPQKVGPPIARELSTWAAMALACNGQLPGGLQSRSVVILLRRALPEEAPEYLETRSTPELVDIRRQLSAWAPTVPELPLPKREEMPAEVYNRVGQNWRPLFAIARLAGAAWVARIENAAMESIKTETLPTLIERLLPSIKRAFGENPKPKTWLDSTEVAARLVAQEGEQWTTINRGGPVDTYWLRKNLVGLLQPAGAQDWWETLPGGRGQRHRSGYFYDQFSDAFRRHPEAKAGVYTPDDTPTENPPKRPGVSGVSGGSPKNPKETAIFDTPDEPGASGVHRVYEKASESATDEPLTPGTPDTPDPSGAVCEEVSELDEFAWARGPQPPAVQGSTAKPEKPPENRQAPPGLRARPRRAKPNGPAAGSGEEVVQRHLEAPGSFLLVTMVEGEPHYSFEDGTPVPLSVAQFTRLAGSALVPVEGESLLKGGSPQRYVARQQAPVPSYAEGSIAEEIRQLRAANPKRSLRWIAKQSGQPPSFVREILGNGEAAP